MRNLKRVLSLALALVMVLGMMVITTSAADFTDAEEITNTEAVEVMSAIGILEGNPDGSFNPNGTLTRAQAAKLIAYMLGYGETAEKLTADGLFTDVGVGMSNWASGYIAFCASRNIIAGVGDNKFNPTGELKDIELGKMILVALGYDSTGYVGSNWAANVTVDMLDAGLVNEVTGTAISREDACAMLLAAMTWTDGGDIYTVYEETSSPADGLDENDNELKVYTEAVDAYFAANAMGGAGANIYVDVSTSDAYLLNTVYGVVADNTPDAFGRPGTSYDLNDAAGTVLKYSKTPVATFDTVVSEKDFFKALGAKGVAATGKRYITVTTTTEDGQQVDHWASAADNSQTYACPGRNMQIDNNSNFPVPGTGEGVTVEVYKNRTPNTYTMVAIRQYMGVVTGVTPANEIAGTDRTVTIRVPGYVVNTFKTESFEKGDDVLVTMADGVIKTAVAPNTLKGKVTKITNGSVFTIGEQDVKLSQLNTCGAPSLGAENTWYVDAQGNLIAIAAPGRVNKYYGYLLDYEVSDKVSGNLLGAGATEAAEKFEFVDSTGEVVVLDGAFTTKPNGTVDQYVAKKNGATVSLSGTDWAVDYADVLFAYELNADGKISKVYAATDATGTTRTVTKGNATVSDSGLLLTEKTVFFYVDTTNDKYAVYTGYTNVPTTKTGTETGRVYANGTLNAMVLSVSSVETSTKAEYVYFGSTDKIVEATAKGTVTTYTNLYINGVKADAGLVLTNDPSAAGTLYTFTTNNTNGKSTLAGSNLLGAEDEITSIQANYIKATSAGVKYVDEDTVYYEINTNAKTIEVVEGLPALSNKDAYSVNLLYVDGGADADHAAKAIFFNVGA